MMGIWIRSQDGEILAECNALVASPSENNGFYIYADSKGEKVYLGHYSTREKALKVLDRIQDNIEFNISHLNLPHFVYCVFQMPKDSEINQNE